MSGLCPCAYCNKPPIEKSANAKTYIMCTYEGCPAMPIICNDNAIMARKYWDEMQLAINTAYESGGGNSIKPD